MITMEVQGLRDAIKSIRQFEPKTAKKAVRRANKASARIIQQQVIADCPVKTGRTREAIKVKAGLNKKNYISALICVGKSWFHGDTFYAAFVQFGHKTGRRSSSNRKQVPAHDFMGHAYDLKKDAALNKWVEILTKEVEAVKAAQ